MEDTSEPLGEAGAEREAARELVHVRLGTDSRAENVVLARELVQGVGDALGLDAHFIDTVKTAVNEAANNVVMHAYQRGRGPMQIDITTHPRCVRVVVRDWGEGIRPHSSGEDPAGMHGVGLSVIQAFADRVEFRGGNASGTELCMDFLTPSPLDFELIPPALAARDPPPARADTMNGGSGHDARLAAPTGPVGSHALVRVTSALALRAGFSLDRLGDAQLVADAIAAHAPEASLHRAIDVGFTAGSRTLELRVGALARGAGARLVERSNVHGLGPIVARLSDELHVQAEDGGDVVIVRLNENR